jgi:RimJ/RimL family protein N-acetyltransferase
MTTLLTPRLRLEPFQTVHRLGLNQLNSDPEVMRYLTGRPETQEETDAVIERVQARWAEHGFSWWSLIDRESGEIVGAGCIQHLARVVTEPLEIGWRLRPDQWGKGLATEAARAMGDFAFRTQPIPLLVAVCHVDNEGSARVMQRLGMTDCGLSRAYDMAVRRFEITRQTWEAQAAQR